jgi:hypothetical protein
MCGERFAPFPAHASRDCPACGRHATLAMSFRAPTPQVMREYDSHRVRGMVPIGEGARKRAITSPFTFD